MDPVDDSNHSETVLADQSPNSVETVIPVYVEEAVISKKQVATGRVRVATITKLHEQAVDELLEHERVEVERKPIGKRVASMPKVREEDGVIIIPVVEEEIVVERHLVLKEEVYVRRIRETEKFQEQVQLRRQEASITRLPGDSSVSGGSLSSDSPNQVQNKEK